MEMFGVIVEKLKAIVCGGYDEITQVISLKLRLAGLLSLPRFILDL